jgi:hypothetical protein
MTDLYDVTWNGTIERQFAEDVRTQAEGHVEHRPIPTREVFRRGSLGAVLEAAIRAAPKGAPFTPRSVGHFLNIPRNTAATMLRKACERGLLDALDTGRRDATGRRRAGVRLCHYAARGPA